MGSNQTGREEDGEQSHIYCYYYSANGLTSAYQMHLEFLELSTYITIILIHHRLITVIIGKIDYNESLPEEPFDCLDVVLFW